MLRPIYQTGDQTLYEDSERPGWGVVWDKSAGRGWRGVYVEAVLKQHGYWRPVTEAEAAALALPGDAPLTDMPASYTRMFEERPAG
jgi:hypothetical protein